MHRGKGLLAAVFAVACICGSPGAALAARPQPSGIFTPGVVQPPPLGFSLHNDVVWHSPAAGSASASVADADVQEIPTADGMRVRVETSPSYQPSFEYDTALVAFLDSLVHGRELNNLKVYVATPSEMKHFCGGLAAACFIPGEGRIYIVGQEEFGGLPTTYVLAHEYGHRIEAKRRNPPFPGGPLLWGTKRWASVEGVCQGTREGKYAPGDEGRRYFENPGEAFAESYAWSQFGSRFGEWRWAPSLHPNPVAFAAIRNDVLHPWVPQQLEAAGQLTGGRSAHVYRLRPKSDGGFHVRMSGSGKLELALLDARGNLLAVSSTGSRSRGNLNYLVCGDRNLRLFVRATDPPGRYRLQISMP